MNELDCNGWSPKYKSVRPTMRGLCTDPVLRWPGKKASRFIDNGWYVGHDEPSVKFISNAGSGQLCEFADGYCFRQGSQVLISGKGARESARVTGCFADQFQNVYLDFDGTPYQRNRWPDGSSRHPTPTPSAARRTCRSTAAR